jgi:protein required for attachment to host cells
MYIRIVVADESTAIFYDLEGPTKSLQLAGRIDDPRARLHDQDLVSDRPGRVFDHGPLRAGRRGASPHHGTGGEHDAHKHEVESFARQLAHELETAQRAGSFDRLVVMAGPKFLGMLREVLPASVSSTIAAEVAKDLVHQPPNTIKAHLPQPLATLQRSV